ncbi:MAG: alpha/beta fold hydrolase [Vicinamibacterales bacterium]
MKISLYALAFCLAASTVSAQTPVTLKAPDGLTLKATYSSAEKPGPGLVLLHQCNQDKSGWAGFAAKAAARGYHVIAMDYRGFGESEGARFSASPDTAAERQATVAEKWPGDVDTAFAWLVKQPGVDGSKIGAAGASCGVNQAVLFSARHPEVKSLVLLSGGVTPAARAHLQKVAVLPVLAAGSTEDGDIVDTMRWILGWAHDPRNKFLQFTGAGHGTEMFAPEKTLEPQLLDWFDATLLRPQTTTPPASMTSSKPSPVEDFWAALSQPGGAAKARALYDASKKSGASNVVLFPETELNAYGYQMMQDGRGKEAIIAFQMNVDEFPQSANAHDSLSDGYLADGNKVEALKHAEKALALLPQDARLREEGKALVRESAQRKVDQLKKIL